MAAALAASSLVLVLCGADSARAASNPMRAVAGQVDEILELLDSPAAIGCAGATQGCPAFAVAARDRADALDPLLVELAEYLPDSLESPSSEAAMAVPAKLRDLATAAEAGTLTVQALAGVRKEVGLALHSERPVPPVESIHLGWDDFEVSVQVLAEGEAEVEPRPEEQPLTATAVAPAVAMQAMPPTDPDLLAETLEVEFTPELDELLASLQNDPLLVYGFVRTAVQFTPYYGSRKSSTYVLETHAGNDFDQASLLIAAFRRLGIPSRYVRGTIEVPNADIPRWVGTDTATAALTALASGAYPYSTLPGRVRVEHVWVEAFLSIADYRGIGGDVGGPGAWVPLSPSYVLTDSAGGVDLADEIGFDIDTFLASTFAGSDVRNPAEVYQDSLKASVTANHPEQTLFMLLRRRIPTVSATEVFPLSTPFTVVEELETSPEVPDLFRHEVTVTSGTLTHIFHLAELGSRLVTLAFEPATQADRDIIAIYGNIYDTPANLINVRPELRVEKSIVATGDALPFGSFVDTSVSYAAHGHPTPGIFANSTLTSLVGAGRYALLLLPDKKVAGSSIPDHMDALQAGVDNFGDPGFDLDETLGEAMFLQALEYFRDAARRIEFIERTSPLYYLSGVGVGLVGPMFKVLGSGGDILSVEPQALRIDVIRSIGATIEDGPAPGLSRADFLVLKGLELSALEHSVFEDLFSVEAVSTVKILQAAADAAIPVLDIDETNRGVLVPQLTLPAPVVSLVDQLLDAGYRVFVNRDEATVQQWTGCGWFAFQSDGSSLIAGISGLLNGGNIAELKEHLKELVRTGYFSQEEADAIIAGLEARLRYPVKGPITDTFRIRPFHPVTGKPNEPHEGLDFGVPIDTPVQATGDGVVEVAWDIPASYGLVMIVNYGADGEDNSYYGLYAHLDSFTAAQGASVSFGDELALNGESGLATKPHLHYEVFIVPPGGPVPSDGNPFLKGGFEVDPEDFVFPEDLTMGDPP